MKLVDRKSETQRSTNTAKLTKLRSDIWQRPCTEARTARETGFEQTIDLASIAEYFRCVWFNPFTACPSL